MVDFSVEDVIGSDSAVYTNGGEKKGHDDETDDLEKAERFGLVADLL